MKSQSGIAAAAIVCGLLAAWLTWGLAASGGEVAGPRITVPVVVEALDRGEPITADAAASLDSVEVPRSQAPADAFENPADVVGARPLVDLAPGTWLTSAVISGGEAAAVGYKLRKGERAITVDVVVTPKDRQLAVADRVDLLASGFGGDDRTQLELAGADVLAITEGASGRSLATVRVAAAQAPRIVRADVFAKELRAVIVP